LSSRGRDAGVFCRFALRGVKGFWLTLTDPKRSSTELPKNPAAKPRRSDKSKPPPGAVSDGGTRVDGVRLERGDARCHAKRPSKEAKLRNRVPASSSVEQGGILQTVFRIGRETSVRVIRMPINVAVEIINVAVEIKSRISSSRFAASRATRAVMPVTFPPGRARLVTRPSCSGSSGMLNTIGIVVVAILAAIAVPGCRDYCHLSAH
jgi:hypothetical protein